MIQTVTLACGGHQYVYRFSPKQSSEFVWRVYRDSRSSTAGFSLALVLQAIRAIG